MKPALLPSSLVTLAWLFMAWISSPLLANSDPNEVNINQTLRLSLPSNKTNVLRLTGMQILIEAYETIGISVEFIIQPAERALQQSNSGSSDGELFRITGLSDTYPNLIQIPVALMTTDIRVFTTRDDIIVDGWKSLQAHHIGFHKGFKYAEFNSQKMKRSIVTLRENVFKMLQAERFDFTIADSQVGRDHIRKYHLSNIKMLSPALAHFPLFHYLNKKHDALIPRITAALQAMKASGRMKAIRSEVEAVMASSLPK